MNKTIKLVICFLLAVSQIISAAHAQSPTETPLVHDPVMIKQDSVYYLFCTGKGISCYTSKDMRFWQKEQSVFSKIPEWITAKFPNFKGDFWAPDIHFFHGKYYLFYAVSRFGKNTSCIGVATNTTLNPASPAYRWEDKGMLVQSVPGRDRWNAIDPAFIVDENNAAWLCFGSFWDGIKLVKLNNDISGIDESQTWFTLASRPRDFTIADTLAGNGAIEAPFIFKHDKYYYLFVSFDYCCRGIKSNYKVMVGRSANITGPYVDKENKPMQYGGGSLVAEGGGKWAAVGHNAVYHFDNDDYIIYHGYNIENNGKPTLVVHKLSWDEQGWPVVEK
ncbi:MAG: arabinan endo-1,5-alpha-L-arabinosidase [Chitinophagaceae bacterium]|jgi:arabinan endo-1,5-alpha-L-arabinosidase|nr:arabinan endo-1,5-alpha-L-arabinosidase [Chitinophagaceae bacterium]